MESNPSEGTRFFYLVVKSGCLEPEAGRQLYAYTHELLNQKQELAFERHLRRCVRCAADIMNRQAIRAAAKSANVDWDPEAPPQLEAVRRLNMKVVEVEGSGDWIPELEDTEQI